MMEYMHGLMTQLAATSAGFSTGDVAYLVSHIEDPDNFDLGFDRGFKHIYIPATPFGCAASSACINYRKAVNTGDLQYLAMASHYMEDLCCVFHTDWRYQNHHKLYEAIVDTWVDDIILNLVQFEPIFIDNVYWKAVELAELTETLSDGVFDAYFIGDNVSLFTLTLACINNGISYTLGMYQKFLLDVASGATYSIPAEHSLNGAAAGVALTFIAPFLGIMI